MDSAPPRLLEVFIDEHDNVVCFRIMEGDNVVRTWALVGTDLTGIKTRKDVVEHDDPMVLDMLINDILLCGAYETSNIAVVDAND